MEILLWPLGILFGIYLTFRLFGRQILTFGMKQVLKRLVKDAEAQSSYFRQHYGGDAFNEQVFQDEEIKVSSPRHQSKKQVSADEIAEDVDFEEVQ